jgi:hypothetical protein
MKFPRLLNWRGLAYISALVILIAFPYGPLFPWSPVTPGYSRLHLERADILFPNGTKLPDAYRSLDRIISDSERFHRLHLHKRITVIDCRDWNDFSRFDPTMNTSHAVAAITLATGTVIYVTPKTTEKNLDLEEFLRHEVSHATLHQNQSLLHSIKMPRIQPWFLEGLAVSFGRQKSYVSAAEFLSASKTLDLTTVIDPQQATVNDMRFKYQAWRYFLEHLIATRGRDQFQLFLQADLANPNEYRNLFQQTYGTSLPDAVIRFQDDIRNGSWQPDPDFALK